MRGLSGLAPRHYEIGASRTAPSGSDSDPAYLDPGHPDPDVARWARTVAQDVADPERLARAFVSDLSRRPYSLDTRGIDPERPLASFLAGAAAHCEYFASSMVIGLRLRGIPARVVGGFLGADRSSFSDELQIGESRAHLWVEADIPGAGWTRFDPTPEAGRVPSSRWRTRFVDGWQRVVRGWDAWIVGLDLGDQADLIARLRHFWDLLLGWAVPSRLGILACVFASAVAAAAALRFRTRRARRDHLSGVPEFYHRVLALAARRGFQVGRSETAREFAERAADGLGDREAIMTVSSLYEVHRFGGRPLTTADLRLAKDALRRLQHPSKPRAA